MIKVVNSAKSVVFNTMDLKAGETFVGNIGSYSGLWMKIYDKNVIALSVLNMITGHGYLDNMNVSNGVICDLEVKIVPKKD